jgi:putative membrane protein
LWRQRASGSHRGHYGLEGTYRCFGQVIITNATPRFKTGDFGGGITRGVDDIITVLTTDASEWQQRPSLRLDNQGSAGPANWLVLGGLAGLIVLLAVSRRFRWFFFNVVLISLLQSGGSRGSGGFSGSGGSSGSGGFRAAAVRRAAADFGELVMELSQRDRAQIAAAICQARTSGKSSASGAGSVDATALPIFIRRQRHWRCHVGAGRVPSFSVQSILLWQVAAFLVLVVVLCLPRVRVALLPRAARRAVAHRAAMEQFTIRGLARKKDRTGILIFVSLAERYARIIADEGVASRVPQSHWQGAIDVLVAHMRNGNIADGFITAIDRCGSVLAEHFPRSEASNDELPDRIYLV